MRYIFLVFLLYLSNTTLWADSFAQSKKILKEIYKNNQITFYCGCNYNYENKGNMIERSSCGYEPRNSRTKKGNINERARRIECIMPLKN